MSSSITILFKGVCTHLIMDHTHNAPRVSLTAPVEHRVHLGNSRYPKFNKINERPMEHQPILRILNRHLTDGIDGLDKMTTPPTTDTRKILLRNWIVSFDGVMNEREAKPMDDLAPLPKTYFMDRDYEPKPDGAVLSSGWSNDKTAACIDFTTGVRFTSGPNAVVVAQVSFKNEPSIVFRKPNGGALERYRLKPNTMLEISNEPVDGVHGGQYDYLLHYLVTDLDFEQGVPNWNKGTVVQPAGAALGGDVYCSNSTYP